MGTYDRILAIGAHPDDVEFGCSGTLQLGRTRSILVLSKGERGGSSHQRLEEASAAAKDLRASLKVCDQPDTQLSVPGLIPLIEDAAKRGKYTLILTMSEFDMHQDHRAVYTATCIALRSHQCTILSYMTPSNSDGFKPNWFVPLSSQIMRGKLKAISCHRSQRGRSYLKRDYVTSMAKYWAMLSRSTSPFVEPFTLIKHFERDATSRAST